jgi:hypothetical protein
VPAADATASSASAGSQHGDDARAGDLQHVGDVVVGEEGQRVEGQLAVVVLAEHVVEAEGMGGAG